MKETEQQHPPQIIELSEFQPQPPSGPAVLGGNMRLLQGVKVKLTVVVGEAQTTLGELMDLKEASILKIDREVDYPVDVLVEGNVVAAAIPREGPLEWSNYLFDCKAGTGRVLQAWQTDRAGASKDMGSVDGDYAPIEEDTIVGQIMAVACGEPTPYFVPITGDVLAAADAALAVAR